MSKLSLTLCFAIGLAGAIDPDLPSPAPVVRSAFPAGVQRGTSAEVELKGQNLHDTRTVEFAGRGVKAEVISSFGSKVKLKITAVADAEVGRRDYRLTTARGVYVGVFDIGALSETIEKENNDDWRKPPSISLPILVNGEIGSEDWDHFKFHAEAGQTMIFDVSATRHGSRLDADVAVLDEGGEELAWVDDTTIFGDPHLKFTFAKTGDYVVRVGSLNGGGNYRLSAGVLPYARRTFPAGLEAGKPTVITFTGSLLDGVDEIWIGDRLAKGHVLSKSAGQVRARFTIPKETSVGSYRVHLAASGKEVATPTEIRVSRLPELTITKPSPEWKSAQPIPASVVLNGIIDQPKASHWFRFDAQRGDTFLFRAESMKLGYHLDPTITVLDADGKSVAFADDPGIDDRSDEYQIDPDLSLRCEKAGPYYVAIRDSMYRGGHQLLYRLTVRKQAPDFILELRESLKSFYVGQQDTLQVRVRRRSGWNSPVEVWTEGLPTGVVADRQTADVKDSIVKDTCGVERVIDGTIVLLPVRVEASPTGTFDFKVKGRGVMDGKTVEREAIVRYNHASAGYVYGPMQIQRGEFTVAEPPRVLITGPDNVDAGSPLKLRVRRFGEAKQTAVTLRPKSPAGSLRISPVRVQTGASEATLKFEGEVGASGVPVVFEVVSDTDGTVIGESAPILIEARK
ncbi:MAG TPA: PPC domain-containing protein [Bryobacteraceae bacterium]|nr:PPC domain-containing protein [Bryobacteraceae bacterium]